MIKNLASPIASVVRSVFIVSMLVLLASAANAQRGGSAARGGSVKPEGVKAEEPAQSQTVGIAKVSECDPATVIGTCPGTFSLSYGFSANASPRHGGPQTERAGFAFAVYVTRRVFLEIDNDNVVSVKSAPNPRVTGFGDTTFYVGADAVLEGKGRPGITVLYGLKAPTASETKGLGSGEVDHTLLAAFGKTLGSESRSYLEFDIGDYIARDSTTHNFDHFPFAAGIFERKLGATKKYRWHTEVGGSFATSASNADMYTLNYLQTKLTDHVAIRTGARFGLTPNSPRAGIYLAVKFSGNLK